MYLYLIAIVFVLFLMMQNKTRGINKSIEKLIRQSARYATAAQQDKSPVIAHLRNAQSLWVRLTCTWQKLVVKPET